MIRRLDHIAIAVPDLQRAIRLYAEDLGLTLAGTEDVPTERTSTAFFPIEGTRIELVHPMDGQGPIATFLDKRGGGLHHVCFETDDLDGDVVRLKGRGWIFLSEAARPGAHGSRVIFAHPRSCEGVLVELSEPAKASA
ncbi:MAG: methylmalonyl-CoA epimerase [Myxococcales bacterium]|nr:methylmalonyl-CoA epimerase [Myxococcales bacterium]